MFRDLLTWLLCIALTPFVFAADNAKTYWLAPTDQSVAWKGLMPTEGGGVQGGQQILYPTGGAGLAGLIAAVATHAFIINRDQADHQKRALIAADGVLDPYRTILGQWQAADLWSATAGKDSDASIIVVRARSDATTSGNFIQTTPTFFVSLDYSVLILETQVMLVDLQRTSAPLTATIRVVSEPVKTEKHREYWGAEDGKELKATAQAMLRHVLTLSGAIASGTFATSELPHRTIRYPFGMVERTERAQVLHQGCGRTVLRDLRGAVVSVPRISDENLPCPNKFAL